MSTYEPALFVVRSVLRVLRSSVTSGKRSVGGNTVCMGVIIVAVPANLDEYLNVHCTISTLVGI